MTLAIGHREGDTAIVDALREVRPPFGPETVVAGFVDVMRPYGIRCVEGDRYGGEWPRAAFRKLDISYEVCSATKSALYTPTAPSAQQRQGRTPRPPASYVAAGFTRTPHVSRRARLNRPRATEPRRCRERRGRRRGKSAGTRLRRERECDHGDQPTCPRAIPASHCLLKNPSCAAACETSTVPKTPGRDPPRRQQLTRI